MAARVHVTDTYDVPDTDDADADTDDDAGPCEDIVVLAKTHSGASEDTYCGSDDDDDDDYARDDYDGNVDDDNDAGEEISRCPKISRGGIVFLPPSRGGLCLIITRKKEYL